MNLSPSPFSKNSRTQTLDIYTGFFFAVPLWVLYRLVDFFCWFLFCLSLASAAPSQPGVRLLHWRSAVPVHRQNAIEFIITTAAVLRTNSRMEGWRMTQLQTRGNISRGRQCCRRSSGEDLRRKHFWNSRKTFSRIRLRVARDWGLLLGYEKTDRRDWLCGCNWEVRVGLGRCRRKQWFRSVI